VDADEIRPGPPEIEAADHITYVRLLQAQYKACLTGLGSLEITPKLNRGTVAATFFLATMKAIGREHIDLRQSMRRFASLVARLSHHFRYHESSKHGAAKRETEIEYDDRDTILPFNRKKRNK
jgi:hypothetical protein